MGVAAAVVASGVVWATAWTPGVDSGAAASVCWPPPQAPKQAQLRAHAVRATR